MWGSGGSREIVCRNVFVENGHEFVQGSQIEACRVTARTVSGDNV